MENFVINDIEYTESKSDMIKNIREFKELKEFKKFWEACPDRFLEYYFGIKFLSYQRIILRVIMEAKRRVLSLFTNLSHKELERYRLGTLEAQEAVNILCDHFLGEDWYIADPVKNSRANAIIVHEIIKMYPNPKWPKKWKTRNKKKGV